MPTYQATPKDYVSIEVKGKKVRVLSKTALDRFSTGLLGLGDITLSSRAVDAIAAVFDLEGFTHFCKQIEPHLSVPVFLSEFLDWLMTQLKEEMTNRQHDEGATLWSPLPFFVKFLGDGILVLWDSSAMGDVERRNIIVSAQSICRKYSSAFVKTLKKKLVDPPPLLRCGLARGTVFSVGDGSDYVGSCINMASRLQKLPGTTFAFNRRGFVLEGADVNEYFSKRLIVKDVAVRGIGDHELVAILKKEFEAMQPDDKGQFRDLD
jgi:class 3 adenylate cyclase